MRIFKSKMLSILFLFSVSACGITSPEFEDYEEEDGSGGGGGSSTIVDATSDCGQTAVASFEENVKPAISSVCAVAGCHTTGSGAAKLPLTGSDSEADRSTLFGYTGFDTSKLNTFFTSGQHSGGDKSGDLSGSAVTTWLNVEAGCTEG